MKSSRLIALLLGLALILPAAAAAQEPAPKPPLLLVAHLHALDVDLLPASVLRGASRSTQEDEPLLLSTLGPSLWSAEKMAATLMPPLRATVDAAPPVEAAFTSREEGSPVLRIAPLPRNFSPNVFGHGRARGPFEQVYPRL